METTELFYPQLSVQVGQYTFDQGIKLEVHSSRESYFDWAKVVFTEQYQPEIKLSRKEVALIKLGYNGVFDETFAGYVAKPYNEGGSSDEIILKDSMLLLEEIKTSNTFLDTTPQEMISYFLSKAGITKMNLSAKGYPKRKQIPICEMSLLQAINTVHAAWGINPRFFFSGGVFYWDEKPKQDKEYIFEYGVNIISLTRAGGFWELETVSAPFVKHSHNIVVNHPKISGTFEVQKVNFISTDEGFLRTYISFK
jgi:hypothetical protein